MNNGHYSRKKQIKAADSFLQKDINYPILVCGDLNDTGGKPLLSLFRSIKLRDAWWNRGIGFGFTYHGMGLRFRLDHLLYTNKNIVVDNIKVKTSSLSDHHMLVGCFFFK